MKQTLRVVPLFETLDDLEYSESAMEQLLSNPWYADHIKGVQECMIGYSDSGKDAGRLAAAWGLYEVQVRCKNEECPFHPGDLNLCTHVSSCPSSSSMSKIVTSTSCSCRSESNSPEPAVAFCGGFQ